MAGGFALAQQHRQRVEQHFANRVMIVVGRPQQHAPEHRRVERFAIQHLHHAFQLSKRQFALFANRHYHADALLATERHAHATTRRRRHRIGQ